MTFPTSDGVWHTAVLTYHSERPMYTCYATDTVGCAVSGLLVLRQNHGYLAMLARNGL